MPNLAMTNRLSQCVNLIIQSVLAHLKHYKQELNQPCL